MKTKTNLSILFIALFLLIIPQLKAQNASGNVISRDFTVDDFSGIDLSEPMDYLIVQGDKNLVKIETDDNLLDKVKTEVRNGILSVDTRSLGGASQLKVTIQVKELKNISISGAATLKSENALKSTDLKIDASGAAEVKLEVNVENLETDLSGAAEIKLSGNALHHSVKASGAADLKAEDLQTSTTEVHMTGASSAKIEAKDKLSGNISGISDVKYKNKPAIDELSKSDQIQIEDINSVVENEMNNKEDTIDRKEAYADRMEKEADGREDKADRMEKLNDGKGKFFEKGPGKLFKGNKNKTQIHWSGINIGINGYLDSKNKFDTPVGYDFMKPDYGKSWFVDLNFVEYGLPIIKHYWHLVTGMGFQFNNYVIEKDHIIKPNTDYLEASLDTTVNYKKNKLSDVYFQIPLLFQFDTKKIKKNNTFHLLFGVVGGVKVASWTKQKYEFDDSKNIRRTRDDFNLSPFRWSAMVKLGYGPVNLFASYQLNQMFKPNQGPQLYPFTVGITLLGF
jgi:hypothetical protein